MILNKMFVLLNMKILFLAKKNSEAFASESALEC